MKRVCRGKFFVALMVLLLGIALVASGCSSSAKPTVDKQGEAKPADKKEMKIGLAMPNSSHPYRRAIIAQAQAEAKKYPNVKLIITDGQKDSLKQIAGVEDMIAQKVDLVMMSPNQTEALTPAVDALKKAGIPLVVFDRKVATQDYTSFLGADNSEMGETAGKFIAERLKGKGVVIQLEGTQGASATIERKAGFERVMKDSKDIKVVSQSADYNRDAALKVMENLLQSNKQIDAVFAHNDEMALGALQALKAANRLKGTIIVGMDGQKEALDAIKAGEMTGTVQYPTTFPDTFDVAMKILKGEKVEKNIKLMAPLIQKDNVDKFQGI